MKKATPNNDLNVTFGSEQIKAALESAMGYRLKTGEIAVANVPASLTITVSIRQAPVKRVRKPRAAKVVTDLLRHPPAAANAG